MSSIPGCVSLGLLTARQVCPFQWALLSGPTSQTSEVLVAATSAYQVARLSTETSCQPCRSSTPRGRGTGRFGHNGRPPSIPRGEKRSTGNDEGHSTYRQPPRFET